ncbi:hypothetical protein N9Q84_03150 [Flavobacteriaceae bacterium]|nr:hypothetical protein [Flavobacteriaceae bacterium]
MPNLKKPQHTHNKLVEVFYFSKLDDLCTVKTVLDLGNKIFGEWGLEFWMLVPNDKEGYFNLQGTVPIGSGEWVVGNQLEKLTIY